MRFNLELVQVTADDALVQHVAQRGGVLWVRADRHRCCTGALTTLIARTEAPSDPSAYEPIATGLAIDVRYAGGSHRPRQLALELRGRRRPRPAAYWDGCVLAL